MNELDHFVGVDFHRFKAFKRFTLDLQLFNVLVGPNNAGKSTILAAFRILAHAMRRAEAKRAEPLRGPSGTAPGHKVDICAISVAEENIFYDYDDDEPASVRFRLKSGNSLTLYFPEREVCFLIPDAQGRSCSTPTTFRSEFRCPVGFVPILGPVEHNEDLYERDAARRALYNYRAARNFRNIWHHYPESFDEFAELVRTTWPGMDVLPPEIDRTHERPRLHMWCPEKRKPREIFWAGFGFQVWCQMLTHLIQGRHSSIFLIDEPDIYLHSDLQRQLVAILRSLGPDILLATHSTEIIAEVETDQVVLVDKRRDRSKRLRNADQLDEVFRLLGSGINPVLTQLAKTRKVLFVEGGDFQLLGRFARKLGLERLANRTDFAVVKVEGFNPERMRNLKAGMEQTLGSPVSAAAILDRDYRPDEERAAIKRSCEEFCDLVVIHDSKEIENFLLVPDAIDRAAAARLSERVRRGAQAARPKPVAAAALEEFADARRTYTISRLQDCRSRFEKSVGSTIPQATILEREMAAFELRWANSGASLRMIPGKDALAHVNQALQERLGVSVTPTGIVEAMRVGEVPGEMASLLHLLSNFAAGS